MVTSRGFAICLVIGAEGLLGCSSSREAPHFTTPIEHVVVIVKENHTFDNYFAGFPGADETLTATLSDGGVITRPEAPSGRLPGAPPNGYRSAITAWRDGGMNGFDLLPSPGADAGSPHLQFIYFPESRIPNYWTYAREFVLADDFHTTVFGPSLPGHVAIWAAQSPVVANDVLSECEGPACASDATAGCQAPPETTVDVGDPETCVISKAFPCFDLPIVVDHFPRGLTWLDYSPKTHLGPASPLRIVRSVGASPAAMSNHLRNLNDLLNDIEGPTLPNLLVASVSNGPASEHPPEDPCPGENFTVEIVNRLMARKEWSHTAILIVWDDFGGFYDHVPPEVRRCSDGRPPLGPGFRVPLLIVSPYARRGLVLHTRSEQASLPRLIEDLFSLPRLAQADPHALDEKAGSLLGAFDFEQAPRSPLPLPTRTCR